MISKLLMPAVLLAQMVLASSASAATPVRPRVSQAQSAWGSPSSTTSRVGASVAQLLQQRARKLGEKRALARVYEEELRELDRLKRSRASWRRDRQIRSKKASSQATAQRLSRADSDLRALDRQIKTQRQALLGAIAVELRGTPTVARRAELERLQAQVTASLKAPARKIILPDDSLDQLADPDELAEQIALIQQAERELKREREELHLREQRYARMDRLRSQRARADELSELEQAEVRRTTGRPDNTRSGTADEASEPSPENDDDSAGGTGGGSGLGESGDGPPAPTDDSSFVQSSIVLADVVDSGTVEALRRASGRGTTPKARADAAAQARKQVDQRLERLARSRLLIERHLSKLRKR